MIKINYLKEFLKMKIHYKMYFVRLKYVFEHKYWDVVYLLKAMTYRYKQHRPTTISEYLLYKKYCIENKGFDFSNKIFWIELGGWILAQLIQFLLLK